MKNKITKIVEEFGFLSGLAIYIFGITAKGMSIWWYLGTIISGASSIMIFRRSTP